MRSRSALPWERAPASAKRLLLSECMIYRNVEQVAGTWVAMLVSAVHFGRIEPREVLAAE